MQTHVLADSRVSGGVDEHSIDVLDCTQTVTAEREVVGGAPGAGVAEVERLFAVEGRAWVAVGHGHFGEGEAVEDVAAFVGNVMENSAFARVEAHSETPLLPFDERVVADFE